MITSIKNRLSPISFKKELQNFTEHFIIPESVINAINNWLEYQNERFFILTGKPGTGKSAIAAYLTKTRQDIAAYHFCTARRSHTIEPNCVFLSLAAQLINTIPGYVDALVNTITPLHISANVEINIETIKNSQVLGIVIENLNTNNPLEALDVILRRPLNLISNTQHKKNILIFDALNEAVIFERRENLVRLLASVDDLPSSIRFICTTRWEQRVWSFLKPIKPCEYELKNQSTTIRKYINSRFKDDFFQKEINNVSEFTNRLIFQAQDNFLYVKMLIDAIKHRKIFINNLNCLPSSITEIYNESLRYLIEGHSRKKYKLILAILTVSQEPITQKQISNFTDVTLEELKDIIRVICQFFDIYGDTKEEKYTLFHQSFKDYLIDEVNNSEFWCDPIRQHQRIVDYYWNDAKLWSREPDSDEYLWKYLPYHLSQAGQNEKLRKLLLNLEWLQAKLNATSIHSLIADYDLLPTDQDLVLVQQALRLSASVLEQDNLQLVSQLLGRLQSRAEEGIQLLIEQIDQYTAFPWFRCLTASLTPPGGCLVTTFSGHSSYVSAMALVPGEQQIISASRDWTLRLWDIGSGECLRILEGHKDWVRGVVITANSHHAISVSDDRTIKQWDLDTGRFQNILEEYSGYVTAIATMPDGNRVVIALDNHEVGMWEVNRQQYNTVLQIPDGGITAITPMPSQDHIIFVLDNCTFQLWDLNSQECQRIYSGHDASITTVASTPDGKRAISASYDSTLKVWNLANGKVEHTLQGHFQSVCSVLITPDGKRAVSGSRDRTLKEWDLNTGQCLSTFLAHHDWINCVALIPDSRKVISASDDGTLKVWDLESKQQLPLPDHKGTINDLALTLDGNQLISASRDRTLKIWSMQTKQCEHTLKGHEAQVIAVAVTPDHQAISASADETLKLWNLNTGDCLYTFKGHTEPVNGVAVLHDGKTVISASSDKTLRVWDITSGNCLRIFKGHEGVVSAVKVLPNKHQVISASADRTLRIWDLYTGECQFQLRGHNASVTSVAVTSDGMWAVSASQDTAVKLWNLDTGTCELTLGNHQDWIHAVAVTSDGMWAVSASDDNTLKLWDLKQKRYAASFIGESKFKSCTIAVNTWMVWAGDEAGKIHSFQIQDSACNTS
jgi:WD40 repeat protein